MAREFIPVSEAKKLITDTIIPLLPIKVSLNEAAGLVLAQDIFQCPMFLHLINRRWMDMP